MHIAFLTLFLGLLRGTQPVALDAGSGVAAIELVLDGQRAGRVSGPPWTLAVDFGATLLPHHLEARGLSAEGREIDHIEQWVNLPRPPAEVDLVVDGGAPGKPASVRLSWRDLTGAPPTETRLTLDGAPLALDAAGRAPIAIPAAGAAHVLSAELLFANGTTARKDVVLTGDSAGEVATELTAVPIRTRRPARPLPVNDLAGRLAAGGQPLAVRTVDQEPPQVYVVIAPSFLRDRALGFAARWNGTLALGGGGGVHFLATSPRLFPTAGGSTAVFDISAGGDFDFRALPDLTDPRPSPAKPPQLGDAIAVAGLHALERQTPRAVVLILGSDPADASELPPAVVRNYLAAIGVPLFVWSPHRRERDPSVWGDVEDISDQGKLAHAFLLLDEELKRQQIAWVEGRYLPQAITLGQAAKGQAGLELVTRPAADASAAVASAAQPAHQAVR